ELNVVDTKLLSTQVSNKTEAYRLFRRNVLVTTLESGFVPARPIAYTFARALPFPAWLPRTPAVTGQMTDFIALVAFRITWTVVVIVAF
ncbi:hypothetical protein Tco_0391288, partial [Tanacetum coccineum]